MGKGQTLLQVLVCLYITCKSTIQQTKVVEKRADGSSKADLACKPQSFLQILFCLLMISTMNGDHSQVLEKNTSICTVTNFACQVQAFLKMLFRLLVISFEAYYTPKRRQYTAYSYTVLYQSYKSHAYPLELLCSHVIS